MLSEAEKRRHRCCFTGHRPEKLAQPKAEVKDWLRLQIERAVSDGYTTFVTGMAMGVDIWAGQIVAEMKKDDPRLYLIAAVPWQGFSSRWHEEWKEQYKDLITKADIVKNIASRYSPEVFDDRNKWMVDHSCRLIAYYNGAPGGTMSTVNYAVSTAGIEVVVGGTQV